MREMLAQENSLDAVQLVMPPDGCRAQPVALRSGDALLFNGNVIHGSGPTTAQSGCAVPLSATTCRAVRSN
jgi:ectoine hydroxylase-related dioxygenase (phytanoyl-CoA dioxygenase family)